MTEQRHSSMGRHADEAHVVHHPHRGPILKRARAISAAIVILLLAGAGVEVAIRIVHARALEKSNAEEGKVYVLTTHPQGSANGTALTLPGTLQGMIESPIYARSTGYVLRWNADIGAKVKKGEVLAVIATPEVDQQLAQAKAARDQAASSLDLAKTSAERWEALRKKDAVTQQELNERTSAYTQAQASLAAAEANVKRLAELEQFKNVTAPFDGVVTHRNVEVGDLVDASNGAASGRALFTMAQTDPLRVYVYVPQSYSQRIKVGDKVKVTQTELAGQTFDGAVVRTAGAIDAATRTLQMEVDLPNHDGKLLAGSYVQVALPVTGASTALTVPSNVVLYRPEGTKVAVLDNSGHVKLQLVNIGHDLGEKLEILSGLQASDTIVLNPPDSLADNDVVDVMQAQPATASAEATTNAVKKATP
ncbi:MAG: efflux RND transporter periplasmic adaptor subunit [Burkholderiaceae bacterium]|nr:efflux RND transporter periplasmic adaptor subunit [Burkholderiaceae bacterium]